MSLPRILGFRYTNTRAYNHDCDMMPGWSGSPLMLTRDHIRYVTAVRIDGAFLDAINRLARERPRQALLTKPQQF